MTGLAVGLRRAFAASIGLGLIWVIAAAMRPSSTYHLAPILVTLSGGLVVGGRARGSRQWTCAIVGGAVISLVFTLLLAIAAALEGPSLLPIGGAAAEAVVFTIVSGAGGLIVGIVPGASASRTAPPP